MAQVDRNAYVNVSISLRDEKIQSATEWISDSGLRIESDRISLSIPPGSLSIVELRTKP
jgi:hypothetical protein